FKGNLRAVKLHADDYANPMGLDPSRQALSEYDIRQKAGYIFDDFDDFKKYFTVSSAGGSKALNITEGGVYYFDVASETDLTQSGQVKEIIFHQNTMLIFKNGVKLPKISKSPAAFENKCTMSVISMEGNLTISGAQIAASLCALKGSILKNIDYFQVFGNMVMGGIDFDLSKNGSLFKAAGASQLMTPVLSSVNSGKSIEGFDRVTVIYDPALNPCDLKNYRRHYKYHIASKKTYWKVSNDY
ncbi:MAG TPA: hypothetical protein PK467_14015, partial [Candidatus Wallbacteria bacterium]|nr:hypothetical protein [Candidatus Wallbacteria bacterium]